MIWISTADHTFVALCKLVVWKARPLVNVRAACTYCNSYFRNMAALTGAPVSRLPELRLGMATELHPVSSAGMLSMLS